MYVRINQSGHQNAIAQIEHFRVWRILYRRAHFHNALALDQHFTRLHDPSILHIKQTSRMQHNRARRSLRLHLRNRNRSRKRRQ